MRFTIQQPKGLLDQDPSTTQLASNSLEFKHICGGGVPEKSAKTYVYGFSPITAEVTDENVRKSVCE